MGWKCGAEYLTRYLQYIKATRPMQKKNIYDICVLTIQSFFKPQKMHFTSEERIFAATNYLRIRSFKYDKFRQQKCPFRKILKTTKQGSSLNLNKDRSGRRETELTQENINILQEKLIEDPAISAGKCVWKLVRVHLTELLNAI